MAFKLDLRSGETLNEEIPAHTFDTFKNFRWTQYLGVYIASPHSPLLKKAYLSYLCRKWNKEHTSPLDAVSVDLYLFSNTDNQYKKRALISNFQCVD